MLIPQLFTAAALTGVRASWVLLTLVLAARWGHFNLPPAFVFLASPIGVAGLLGLAIIEQQMEKDEDIQNVLYILQYGLRGTGAAVIAWVIRSQAMGVLPISDWVIACVSASLAMLTHYIRMRLYRLLYGFGAGLLSPRTWLIWLETGGLIGMLVSLILAPWLGLLLVISMAITSLLLAHFRRMVDNRLNRRACLCGYSVRLEASICPQCKAPLEIQRLLKPRWESRLP